MTASDHLSPRQFFHGTSRDLTTVLPANQHQQPQVWGDWPNAATHAYATTDPSAASVHAEQAAKRTGGAARVYRVSPIGPYEKDPDSGSREAYRSRAGWKVEHL